MAIVPFVHVHCHAGHRGEERPRSFDFGGRRIEVRRILEAWLTPDRRCFKVLGDDGRIYILCHDPESSRWEMEWGAEEKGPGTEKP